MNKTNKTKTNKKTLSLDEKLRSYAKEKIQLPLISTFSLKKGTLAILTPLAAASLITSDVNAQCGLGSFDPSAGYPYYDGQLDVDGDGNIDFTFDLNTNSLWMTADGTMSFGYEYSSSYYIPVLELNYGDIILGGTSFTYARHLFVNDINSGTPFTSYVPIKNNAGHLGFIEINFDGAGGFTIDLNQTGVSTAPGPVIAGDCSSFGTTTVPISLVNFDAVSKNNSINLMWSTANELNNEGFEIQRSSDGDSFYKIGWVNGGGTNLSKLDYNFTDKDLRPNVLYYYRFKQIDFDGKFEYSPIVSAKLNTNQKVDIGNIYPNPVTASEFNLDIFAKVKHDLSYELLDALGQLITSEVKILEEGMNTITISTSGLSSGTFFLKINALDSTEYKKIIIN